MNHKNIISQRLSTIPLSLYIHFPWCLSKCPYCDFNSHPLSNKDFIPRYVARLLEDLKNESAEHAESKLESIYFGGGTPSLLPPTYVAEIICEAKKYFRWTPQMEITLELNPGTVDSNLCRAFREAGINRVSVGVQSFNARQLQDIQRIHDVEQVLVAIDAVKAAGFTNFNLDLMFGLPGQNVQDVVADLAAAVNFNPPHLSWYQLTVDPGLTTRAGGLAASLPQHEQLWEMQQSGKEFLCAHGFQQYEVAAFSNSLDNRCRHNMNYWQYGDYLGIGAGAHGKVTLDNYTVMRCWKISDPYQYMESDNLIEGEEIVAFEKLPLEFMFNALRLYQPITYNLFRERTGSTISTIEKQLQEAKSLGMIELQDSSIITTEHGKNFLNNLLEVFL